MYLLTNLILLIFFSINIYLFIFNSYTSHYNFIYFHIVTSIPVFIFFLYYFYYRYKNKYPSETKKYLILLFIYLIVVLSWISKIGILAIPITIIFLIYFICFTKSILNYENNISLKLNLTIAQLFLFFFLLSFLNGIFIIAIFNPQEGVFYFHRIVNFIIIFLLILNLLVILLLRILRQKKGLLDFLTNLDFIANLIFIAFFSTSIYLFISNSFNFFYVFNVFFHIFIALPVFIFFLYYYYYHYKKKYLFFPELKKFLILILLSLIVVLLVFLSFLKLLIFVFSSIIFTAYFFHLTKKLLSYQENIFFKINLITGQLLLYFFIISSLSGIFILASLSKETIPNNVFYFHRYVSFITIFLFLAHFLIPLLMRQKDSETNYLFKQNLRIIFFMISISLVAISTITFLEKLLEYKVAYKIFLSTLPFEKRETPQEKSLPKNVADLLNISESCGENKGCHKDILYDFKNSAHNISLQTPYFQKNLHLLTKEIGEHNTKTCAGCHYPLGMFTGNNYIYYKNHNNFSCVFCHSISTVDLPKDNTKTNYELKPQLNHINIFLNLKSKGINLFNYFLVRLDQLGHKEIFANPISKSDDYCLTCHRLQIAKGEISGFLGPKCTDCHMQKESFLGLVGDKKNHYFPGTNTAIPYILQNQKILEITQNWIRGNIQFKLKGWGSTWTLKEDEYDVPAKTIWLMMNIEPLNKPIANKKFKFKISTSNVGVFHDFPAAPLDLIEVWLEVIVKNKEGKIIYHSGFIDNKNYVDLNAHRLGGYMIGLDGKLVKRNRVWQIKKKIIDRVIKSGATVTDTYYFTIPQNTKDFVSIETKWNYRKLNQEFINWAYPNQKVTLPITEVSSLKINIKL